MWQGQCDGGKSKWTAHFDNRIRHVYCRAAHSYGRNRSLTWLRVTSFFFCRRYCASFCGGCVMVCVRALTFNSKAARMMACLSFLQLFAVDDTTFCVQSLPATTLPSASDQSRSGNAPDDPCGRHSGCFLNERCLATLPWQCC